MKHGVRTKNDEFLYNVYIWVLFRIIFGKEKEV